MQVARQEDESTGYVLPRKQLVQVAKAAPSSVKELQRLVGRGMSDVLSRQAAHVVGLIARVKQSVEEQAGAVAVAVTAAAASSTAASTAAAAVTPAAGAGAVAAPALDQQVAPSPGAAAAAAAASSVLQAAAQPAVAELQPRPVARIAVRKASGSAFAGALTSRAASSGAPPAAVGPAPVLAPAPAPVAGVTAAANPSALFKLPFALVAHPEQAGAGSGAGSSGADGQEVTASGLDQPTEGHEPPPLAPTSRADVRAVMEQLRASPQTGDVTVGAGDQALQPGAGEPQAAAGASPAGAAVGVGAVRKQPEPMVAPDHDDGFIPVSLSKLHKKGNGGRGSQPQQQQQAQQRGKRQRDGEDTGNMRGGHKQQCQRDATAAVATGDAPDVGNGEDAALLQTYKKLGLVPADEVSTSSDDDEEAAAPSNGTTGGHGGRQKGAGLAGHQAARSGAEVAEARPAIVPFDYAAARASAEAAKAPIRKSRLTQATAGGAAEGGGMDGGAAGEAGGQQSGRGSSAPRGRGRGGRGGRGGRDDKPDFVPPRALASEPAQTAGPPAAPAVFSPYALSEEGIKGGKRPGVAPRSGNRSLTFTT